MKRVLPLRSFYFLMSNSVAPGQREVNNDTEDNTVSASEKEVGRHSNSKIANTTNKGSFRQHFVGKTYIGERIFLTLARRSFCRADVSGKQLMRPRVFQ